MINKVFVYGTLKVGGYFASNFDRIRLSSEKAKLEGFDLYKIGTNAFFPGIVPGKGTVIGELHEFPDDKIDEITTAMDYIEGYSPNNKKDSFYLRKTTSIVLEDGTNEDATIYIFNRPVEKSFKKIKSGEWEI